MPTQGVIVKAMFALAAACRALSRTIAVLAIVAFAIGSALAAPRLAEATVLADGCHHQAEQTAANPDAHDCCQDDHPRPADNCLGDCLSACLAAVFMATVDPVALAHVDLSLFDAYFGAAASRPHSQQPEFVTPPPRA